MDRIRIALATLLAAALLSMTSPVAMAQDAGDDAQPSTEQDVRDVLGDRALPPDQQANEAMPEGVRESDNAGTANLTVPTEHQAETVTRSSESNSSVSVGIDADPRNHAPVPGEIANQPPPPPGWPGSRHANRPQIASSGSVVQIDAGPIWNNDDAQGKCPATCGRNRMAWTGDWRTVGFNRSTCDCVAYADAPPPMGPPPGPGTYCEAPANYQCAGCSVHCPGDKIAHCSQGERGIFNKPESTVCARNAACECR